MHTYILHKLLPSSGANPGFSERGFGQSDAYIIVVQRGLFHKEMYVKIFAFVSF